MKFLTDQDVYAKTRVLKIYAEEDMWKAFVVVGPGRHRHRRLPVSKK